jgi:SAM-dependent methyltransferase
MDRLLELTHRAESEHFWFRGFRRFVRPAVARAVAGAPHARLLDCGCGTGVNLPLLAEFGEASGFDLTWQGLAFARSRGERRIARASIGAIPFRSETFDAVTSFDVFQCLPDPVEHDAIREMRRVLKPGGGLVLNLAAFEILRGRHSVLAEEVRRYTRASARRLVEDAGFRVERITCTMATLFPILLAVRGTQRLMSGGAAQLASGDAEITVPAAPINAAMTAALTAEAALVQAVDLPFGSSILVLARRSD